MHVCSTEDLMKIEISIIRFKHELKSLRVKYPYTYKKEKQYKEFTSKLNDKLEIQKKYDFNRYLKNCENEELRKMKNLEYYSKLTQLERQFLIKHNYDYENDKMELFSKNHVFSEISLEWQALQIKKANMDDRDFFL